MVKGLAKVRATDPDRPNGLQRPHICLPRRSTNALDANNERAITEQLAHFYQGKTVVVVAHRLLPYAMPTK